MMLVLPAGSKGKGDSVKAAATVRAGGDAFPIYYSYVSDQAATALLRGPMLTFFCCSGQSQWMLSAMAVDYRFVPMMLRRLRKPLLAGKVAAPFSEQLKIFLTCISLMVTHAVKLMCFQSDCAVTDLRRQAACILSRRHELPGRLDFLLLGVLLSCNCGWHRAGYVCVIGSQRQRRLPCYCRLRLSSCPSYALPRRNASPHHRPRLQQRTIQPPYWRHCHGQRRAHGLG